MPSSLQISYDGGESITTTASGAIDVIRGINTADGEPILTLKDANANPGRTAGMVTIDDSNVVGAGTPDTVRVSRTASGGRALRLQVSGSGDVVLSTGLSTPTTEAVLFGDGDVVLGGSAMVGSEKLRVVGSQRVEFPYSGAAPAGNDQSVARFYEDAGGSNEYLLASFDSNVDGTGWAAGLRHRAGDPDEIKKALVVGSPTRQVFLRVLGRTQAADVTHYVDIGPYNYGMSLETSGGVFEMFIGGGASPIDSGSSVLSVRHRSGGSVDTQGSRVEARDDGDTGGFTLACEYDTPRLYITNTPGGLSVKDVLYTALGGTSASARGGHRFQRKTTPTAGVSMVGGTEAADVYGHGYVATIRTDAIPASGETGAALDSVPASSFVAERVSLTEPVSNATQVNGGTFRSEGRFWTGSAVSTHFGDIKFEAVSGVNEGRRFALYDDTSRTVAFRNAGTDLYLQAPAGGRIFMQDFAGANAMVFHQSGIIEVDDVRHRTGALIINVGTGEYRVNGTKVVGAQGAAVANASGGATVDAEARTAINDLLARCRAHGLIAT